MLSHDRVLYLHWYGLNTENTKAFHSIVDRQQQVGPTLLRTQLNFRFLVFIMVQYINK